MEGNHVPVSRQWLESLSTDELIKLADSYGVDIPPELERIFIIEELLEITNTENQEPSEEIKINPSYTESALLPKQYNISFMEVIIRDPLWVFVFWEVKGQERETHENAADFNGYCLKVIPLDENGAEINSEDNSFTVSVSPNDSARYLGFAEHHSHIKTCSGYIIKLAALRGSSEMQITSSAPFFLPRLSENDFIAEMSAKPLLRLSGIQDLQIIKNSDRQSRIKRV
ncbi:MAG: DUF4912 domain-containing protein [Treponema sp.]|nr:DUF4912 domain-containing protein [Treponema sp.]